MGVTARRGSSPESASARAQPRTGSRGAPARSALAPLPRQLQRIGLGDPCRRRRRCPLAFAIASTRARRRTRDAASRLRGRTQARASSSARRPSPASQAASTRAAATIRETLEALRSVPRISSARSSGVQTSESPRLARMCPSAVESARTVPSRRVRAVPKDEFRGIGVAAQLPRSRSKRALLCAKTLSEVSELALLAVREASIEIRVDD